jgi:hypothetical protein
MPSREAQGINRGPSGSDFGERQVAQRKNLEQQVSTRRQGESDCRDQSDDTTHGA